MIKGMLQSFARLLLGAATGGLATKAIIDVDTATALTAAGVGLIGTVWTYAASKNRWLSALDGMPYINNGDASR